MHENETYVKRKMDNGSEANHRTTIIMAKVNNYYVSNLPSTNTGTNPIGLSFRNSKHAKPNMKIPIMHHI